MALCEISDLAVDVYRNKKYLMSGFANKISLSGMFIACDSSHLHEGCVIEINFNLNSNGVPRKHGVDVLIAKVCPEGIKVGFCGFDAKTFCSVRDMVFTQKQKAGLSIG